MKIPSTNRDFLTIAHWMTEKGFLDPKGQIWTSHTLARIYLPAANPEQDAESIDAERRRLARFQAERTRYEKSKRFLIISMRSGHTVLETSWRLNEQGLRTLDGMQFTTETVQIIWDYHLRPVGKP